MMTGVSMRVCKVLSRRGRVRSEAKDVLYREKESGHTEAGISKCVRMKNLLGGARILYLRERHSINLWAWDDLKERRQPGWSPSIASSQPCGTPSEWVTTMKIVIS